MDVTQTILNLDRSWPCRRSRWWMIMTPKEYNLKHIGDLPEDAELRFIRHLFRHWPQWTIEEEEDLQLTQEELTILRDPAFGADRRSLCQDEVCPCFLHSYSTSLRACPCGCRTNGFHELRLLRDGVRGFYVISHVTGRARWIHPKEAALLCGLDPHIRWPQELRAGLCLVGQCASPLQAAWVGSHFLEAAYGSRGSSMAAFTLYKMWLLRQAHGMVPHNPNGSIFIQDNQHAVPIEVRLKHNTTANELLEAETRLHGEGFNRSLWDLYGKIPGHYGVTCGAIAGHFTLVHPPKRQRKTYDNQMIKVTLKNVPICGREDEYVFEVPTGTYIFEVLQKFPTLPRVHYKEILDNHGNAWRLDERLQADVELIRFQLAENIFAAGAQEQRGEGLGNQLIDKQARRMLVEVDALKVSTWIPAAQCTFLVNEVHDTTMDYWLVAALHGVLRGCAVLQGHWVFIEVKTLGNALHVVCWDGLDHRHSDRILAFAEKARKALVIRTLVVAFNSFFSQEASNTCGTIALLHLGQAIGYWQNRPLPDEDQWHATLLRRNEGEILAFGFEDADEYQVLRELQDELSKHGVPPEKTEERATLGIKKMGLNAVQMALRSKNVWAALKALGSQPKNNYLWIKPDELEKQIRFRAHTKYRASVSEKKKGNSNVSVQKASMDPKMLGLLPNTFITEDGRPITQIDMEMVAADKFGVAFGSLEDAAPFLREDKSITMDALAIITTSPVPPANQGLMPVTNLRYPALYSPTQEAVLIEGSIIQLGDCSVIRKQDDSMAEAQPILTKTFKLTVWRDEWTGQWKEFTTAPVRKIMDKWPRLLLCRGDRCGPECKRFHAPVDSDLDQVVVDLWGRGWFSARGKRATPLEAEQFQVLLRIPMLCTDGLQQKAGQDGIYVEPRREDGKGPADEYTVVWLAGNDKNEAMHKLKVSDSGVALVRFGQRFGIRVFTKDAEALHTDMHPDQPYQQVQVQSVYELRPLPYGVQTAGVRALLKQWGWKAKVLQPFKADQYGQGWLIGAEHPPPATIFQTNAGDVLVTLHKKQVEDKGQQVILSSAKTKSFLKKTPATQTSNSKADKENVMPWSGLDPWGGFNKFKEAEGVAAQPLRTSKLEKQQNQMQDVVESNIKDATEQRFQKLECGLTELKEQNQKFENWFGEAGQSTAALRHDVTVLTGQVKENQKNIADMPSDIRTGFANLEALLSKKQRQE